MAERSELFEFIDPTLTDKWHLGIEKVEQISYTPLRCKIDANVTVTGETGATYVFQGAGTVVEVAKADVPKLLKMRLGGSLCCGDENSNYLFELVQS